MPDNSKFLIALVGVSALAVTLVAQTEKQDKKSAPMHHAGPGILQPQMKVETGSYETPATKLGDAPTQPWTATTVSAAVDGKPLTGKVDTVVGEVIDFSCYLQLGKHGEKHRSCGQKCINSGQPAGLLTKDGTMYLLIDEEHDPRRDGLTELRKAAAEHMGHIVEVTGTLTHHDAYHAIYVQGFLKK